VNGRAARFVQRDLDQPCLHHDAVEYPDGEVVLVNDLRPGEVCVVLQLPAVVRREVVPPLTVGDLVWEMTRMHRLRETLRDMRTLEDVAV
jgi:hypothetical protein